MILHLVGAVRNFANGVGALLRELYRTPPGC